MFVSAPKIKNNKNKNIRLSNKIYIYQIILLWFNKISNISQSHDFADAKYIETKQKYEFYNATPEEKHWLETCIKADQFVPYEEAMKSFIPEYVECIKALTGITIGKILPVKNNKENHLRLS